MTTYPSNARTSDHPRGRPHRVRAPLTLLLIAAMSARTLTSVTTASAGVYGPGINADTKSNRRVDGGLGLAHRFRATTTSRVKAVLIQLRLGSGYSGGDGGRYRVSIQTDDGSSRHHPSGRKLASTRWRPKNSGDNGIRRIRFRRGSRLVKGRIYHLVIKNVSRRPGRNFVSINELYTFERLSPRQPRFRDDIYAVVNGTRRYGSGRSWSVDPRHTPVMDVVFANGRHQGVAYLNALRDHWAPIGGHRMVRERFTVRGRDRHVRGACARVGRQYGRSPLKLLLEKGGGQDIETIRADSSGSVALTRPGADADNGDWVCGEFESVHTLKAGATYNLVLSSSSDTQYSMTPILGRDFSTRGRPYHMKSYHFRSGRGQRSRDGGSSWSDLYEWRPQNTQVYLVTS